jgi:hypothetical protein
MRNNNSLYPRSHAPYTPLTVRPATPVRIGRYIVQRRPIAGEIYTCYELRIGDTVVLSQLSPPSADECANAVRAHQHGRQSFLAHNWPRESIATARNTTENA